MPHPTLFLTARAAFHQQAARAAAPPELTLTFLNPTDKPAILATLPTTEFLITERAGVIDAAMIAAGKNLKLIQRLGSHTWDIDLESARTAGIPVCYWPSRTCANVAEHLVWQLLALARRARELMQIASEAGDWDREAKRSDENTFAYNWSKRERLGALRHSIVGILGCGEIGLELARRLRGFECQVLYHKRNRLPLQVEHGLSLTYALPRELAAQSDFVACLLPYSPATGQSINTPFFGNMKRGAVFVHCGAGGVVDEDALLDALRSGHLGGAALDTYTYEPLRPDDPLLALARDPAQNLILTPHVAAGASAEYRLERAEAYANVTAVMRGEELRYRLA